MNSVDNTLTRASERMAGSRLVPDEDQGGATNAGPVLVAVDISTESRAALLWATEHAAKADLPITVLHVLHDPPESPGKYSRNSSDPLAPMADIAERMLAEFITEVRADHPELERLAEARTKVVNGLPAETIVEEAVRLHANLIVVGSRGETAMQRLMHGSTAQTVARLSSIPVTVVKANR